VKNRCEINPFFTSLLMVVFCRLIDYQKVETWCCVGSQTMVSKSMYSQCRGVASIELPLANGVGDLCSWTQYVALWKSDFRTVEQLYHTSSVNRLSKFFPIRRLIIFGSFIHNNNSPGHNFGLLFPQ
jgi:hypothetical protein